MYYYSDGVTPLLIHCNPNHLEMIHWGHTGLTLEEHWRHTGARLWLTSAKKMN